MIGDKLKNIPLSKLSNAVFRSLNPSIANLWLRDFSGVLRKPRTSLEHLDETINWLCRAQDNSKNGGVCGGYSVIEGWLAPYPETTGYIIPTFYDYAEFSGRDDFRPRAEQLADWEIEVQMPSGAVQAGLYRGKDAEQKPAVFNTGQVILGWCRAYLETKNENYLAAAKRAGDWLIEVQAEDGAWRVASSETETSVHAYDARTAWSLLEIYDITGERKYLDSAKRKLDWTLAQQHANGWFAENAFFVSEDKWTVPPTHTIAYVMEGLFESWRIVGDARYLQATEKTAEKLLRIFELRRFMAGEFDEKWKSDAKYSCLTGNAQIAGVWLKLFQMNGDTRYLNAALKLNDFTKSAQNISSMHGGIRGGIKGSQPIFGRYTPFIYVNWGAKFFADTLLLEEKIMKQFEKDVLAGKLLGVRETENQ
jgi:rhamnogalacturonyl hydrolase YesR